MVPLDSLKFWLYTFHEVTTSVGVTLWEAFDSVR